MTAASRLDLTSRVFCLATILGLSLAFGGPESLQGVLLLAVVATSAGLVGRLTWVRYRWLGLVEGLTAGLLIGTTLPDGALMLPYLMIPALLAGLTGDRRDNVLVVGSEAAGILASLALSASNDVALAGIEVSAPWIVASLGVGLVAEWILRLRGDTPQADEHSYLSARKLLTQLRSVARRLSSGLDPVGIGNQILAEVAATTMSPRAALFIRTDSDTWTPLVFRGPDARMVINPEGELFNRSLSDLRTVSGPQASGRSDCRHRFVFPVAVGENVIGVVIADGPVDLSDELDSLIDAIDEHAIRLDAALVFDEVRSLATVEERQRLAREIHDGVAQELASIGYLVDELAETAVTEAQGNRLRDLRGEVTRVVNELRLSIFDLRSEIDANGGLGSALSTYVRAVGARSGLTVHLTLDEAPRRLRNDVEGELLRITQEAVTNARKHSRGTNLWVDCRIRPPSAHICVQDDGGGLGAARPDSYGIKIMRERAERIGAQLDIREEPAHSGALGTRVTVTLL